MPEQISMNLMNLVAVAGGNMKRRDFIALASGAAAAWPFYVHAQTSAMPVVGFLSGRPLGDDDNAAALRKALAEAGFVEGKNVRIDYSPDSGDTERLVAGAAGLVSKTVTVIVAGGAPAALAAKRATQTIPIVFTSGVDPVQIGLVASFNRPGGNATGFFSQVGDLVGKNLSLLHEIVPAAKRIALLVNPSNNPASGPFIKNAIEAARTLGLEVQVFNATSIAEIDVAFEALARWPAAAVLIGPDPYLGSRRSQIATLTARYKLPDGSLDGRFVRAGGLLAYGPSIPATYALAGGYVARILKGEKPADLPVQQPTTFQLTLNLKTASALGIKIPEALLGTAHEVIE